MTAQLIDGLALAKATRADVAARAAALTAQGRQPGLAVILVGDNPASQVYVRNKVKACEEAGIRSVLEKYDATLTEAELLARVDALNNDPTIHGILVQLPLPPHIDDHKVIEAIDEDLAVRVDERVHDADQVSHGLVSHAAVYTRVEILSWS